MRKAGKTANRRTADAPRVQGLGASGRRRSSCLRAISAVGRSQSVQDLPEVGVGEAERRGDGGVEDGAGAHPFRGCDGGEAGCFRVGSGEFDYGRGERGGGQAEGSHQLSNADGRRYAADWAERVLLDHMVVDVQPETRHRVVFRNRERSDRVTKGTR